VAVVRLYDTLQRGIVEVTPASGTLTMYSCGPTVYRDAHVGNLRSFLAADLIRRSFEYLGTPVRQVQNITDVGHMTDEVFGEGGTDRMQLAVEIEGKSATEIADFYTERFLADIDAFGIRRAHSYPKASEHVPEMIALISKLLERGHAYEIDGTVYYDTASFQGYGKLSGNSLDALEADHRKTIGDTNKKHASDFVLWMSAGPSRVSVFESPWGTGYPGWHIECSAMSMAAFGETFDLHTGGEDNVFPHHEDEIAQSEGATGATVVKHWVHGAHVLLEGKKMAKSSRNDFTLRQLAERGHRDARALRLLYLQSKYRSQLNLTFEALSGAEKALGRWRAVLNQPHPSDTSGNDKESLEFDQRFRSAIQNDLDTPRAVALLSELLSSSLPLTQKRKLAQQWDEVLALDLIQETDVIPDEIRALVEARAKARAEKQWAAADDLRRQIEQAGYEILDGEGQSQVRKIRT
jgi:cysteinyl-tRNA synthetase